MKLLLALIYLRSAAATSDAIIDAHTIVIGSGISGLAAASRLREVLPAGEKIVVLESSDRVGGRLHTLKSHFSHPDTSADIPVDLGAQWIHGTKDNPLTELATEKIQPPPNHLVTDYDNAIYYDQGEELGGSKISSIWKDYDKIFALAEDAQNSGFDVPLSTVWDAAYETEGFTEEQKRMTNFAVVNELELEYAASISGLSSWWFDSDSSFSGADWLFPGGYNQITDYLAKDFTIETSDAVVSISYTDSDSRILVETASGKEYSATKVIVTVPLGVLKKNRVLFTPELPDGIQSAISGLGMGVLDKNVLQFPSNFWGGETKDFFYNIGPGLSRASISPYVENLNLAKYIPGSNMLCIFDSGDTAIANSELEEATRVENIMTKLRLIWPDAPAPTNFKLTTWLKDENSFGSYSYIAPYSSPSSRKAFVEPVDSKVYFAGEHTCVNMPSTAHGAYMSGLDAADRASGKSEDDDWVARCMDGAASELGGSLLCFTVLIASLLALA